MVYIGPPPPEPFTLIWAKAAMSQNGELSTLLQVTTAQENSPDESFQKATTQHPTRPRCAAESCPTAAASMIHSRPAHAAEATPTCW